MLLYYLHGICKNKNHFQEDFYSRCTIKILFLNEQQKKTKFLTKLEYGNMFKEMKNHLFLYL